MAKITFPLTEPAKIFTIDPLKATNLIIKIEDALKGNYSAIGLGVIHCINSGVPAYFFGASNKFLYRKVEPG